MKKSITGILLTTSLIMSCSFSNVPTYTVSEYNNKKSFTVDMGYKTGKSLSLSMDIKPFATKANANGFVKKLTTDISTAQVYLLALPAGYTGTDPIGTGNVTGSPITLTGITGSFNVIFNNVNGLPTGTNYFIGVRLKDVSNVELIKLNNGNATPWTGTTATTPNFALSNTSIFVSNINNSVSSTQPLYITARLLNDTGAKIEATVSSVDGLQAGAISSNLLNSIKVIAGSGVGIPDTSGTQLATAAKVNALYCVAVDSIGNVYITDQGTTPLVEKIDTTGKIKVIAGNSFATGIKADTTGTQNATSISLTAPGVSVDSSGNVYITDYWNHLVEKVDTAGKIKVIAGNSFNTGVIPNTSGVQNATSISLNNPIGGVAIDTTGNVYIADYTNHLVEKIDTAGKIKVIAGNSFTTGVKPDTTGTQNATSVTVGQPVEIAIDSTGNVYIADGGPDHLIEKIDTAGKIKVIAGNSFWTGVIANTSGTQNATSVSLSSPAGVAVDSIGNVYIADYFNNLVERVDTAGKIKVITGNSFTTGVKADTTGTQNATLISLTGPYGVGLDINGNVYIADSGNNLVEILYQ